MPRPDSKPAIVVGMDGSDNGLRALDWAVGEAARRRARVRMVHAYQRSGVRRHLSPQANMVEMYDEGREVFTSARSHLAGDRHAGRVVGTALYEGRPNDVLTDACARSPLCVVGRRGRGRVASRVLGSTSTALAAESAIPLVVVPPEWEPARDDGRPVLVGVDIPPRDTAVLDFAFAAARQASAPLVALCAWDLDAPADHDLGNAAWDVGAATGTDLRSALGDVLGEILAPWRSRFPDVDVTVAIEHAHPAPTLVAHGEQARLLVLGTTTHPPHPGFTSLAVPAFGVGDRTHGAVVRAVLRGATVPAAVIPGTRVDGQAQRAGYFARTSFSRSTNASESS